MKNNTILGILWGMTIISFFMFFRNFIIIEFIALLFLLYAQYIYVFYQPKSNHHQLVESVKIGKLGYVCLCVIFLFLAKYFETTPWLLIAGEGLILGSATLFPKQYMAQLQRKNQQKQALYQVEDHVMDIRNDCSNDEVKMYLQLLLNEVKRQPLAREQHLTLQSSMNQLEQRLFFEHSEQALCTKAIVDVINQVRAMR